MAVATGIEPIGQAFVDLLKMVVIPLVVVVIFVGVGTLGDLRRLGQLGRSHPALFRGDQRDRRADGHGGHAGLPAAGQRGGGRGGSGRRDRGAGSAGAHRVPALAHPEQPVRGGGRGGATFAAAAEGALLPLIVFTILFAAATGALPEGERETLLSLAGAVSDALIKLVHWILWLAPIGVFALAAPVTARAGWAMLQSLGAFILAVLVGLVVFVAIVYLPAVRLMGGMPGGVFLKRCLNPILIAAGTSSTAATLPAMLEAADEELGISRPVWSFVVPLGAGLARMGTALFQGAAIVFLAWLFGVPLAAAGIGGAVLATFIVSFTVPGIPAGGVVSLAPALGAVGVPLDGLAVLLGVDRIPDMARTATNVTASGARAT
jgi:DAACS family dicarboxylate/amino acid:cation (Na+ or H+) symporter